MDITAPIALKDDVLIIPVADLDERTLKGIDCEAGDFAISRPRARSTSTVVDGAAAALIEQFRRPRTIVEAVLLFSKARQFDAATVLDDAYRLVRQMVDQGFMIASGADAQTAQPSEMRPRCVRGDRIGTGEVLRLLQFVEDTEVYLARLDDGAPCVVKMQRAGQHPSVTHFDGEAEVLAALGGTVAPRLIERGAIEGCAFLVMEHCPGLESEALALEYRQQTDGPAKLLSLLQRIARAYARLHERHVVHGDVHPRNVLVDDTGVRVIDFGLGAVRTPAGGGVSHQRGGVAFFHEPETARAALDERPWPAVTETGEQYSVAALLYYLLTGAHYVDFNLGRVELMRQIADASPVPLAQRGLPAWPALEACVFRALAKSAAARYPSTTAFADALDRVAPPARPVSPSTGMSDAAHAMLREAAGHVLRQTACDQPWFTRGFAQGPTASLNYGAAGVAYVLARVAAATQDGALLARADAWACHATRLASRDADAFVNPTGEISAETVGAVSPYHTRSGVAAATAVIAYMGGDEEAHRHALSEFLAAAGTAVDNLDLTLGLSSTILGATQLWATLPAGSGALRSELLSYGIERVGRLWNRLDAEPAIGRGALDNLGVAHGWAGFMYATLTWCAATAAPLPHGMERRLDELARLAEPAGRGLMWPWTLGADENSNYMPGWCNGSAGYVHLWTAAARAFPRGRFTDLAIGSGWDAFDALDSSGTLCCGLAGRAYALLELHRHTGDARWLERARAVGYRSAQGAFEADYPHSLYKGQLVLPILAADLEDPARASQPFFGATPI